MAKNNEYEKYAYLDRLSTDQLKELLRADIESPESSDTDVIFHILEVIKKREREHPTVCLPSEDEAWAEFQQYYNIPEGEGLSLYPTGEKEPQRATMQTRTPKIIRLRPALRMAGIAAAVVVGMFAVMITAQAAGVDVFGAIGRWTDATFHFVTSPAETPQDGGDGLHAQDDSGLYADFQTALDEYGITENLAPTWCPDGFELAETKSSSSDLNDRILCTLVAPDDKSFTIQVLRYHATADIDALITEKDGETVQDYTAGGKRFFLLSNADTTTAVWSDQRSLVLKMTGNISEDDIKKLIDSMGGTST